jgi:hypothetical protein
MVMKTYIVLSAFLLLAVLNACGQADVATVKSEAQVQVDTLTAKLIRHEVGKIEILQIPAYVMTRFSLWRQPLGCNLLRQMGKKRRRWEYSGFSQRRSLQMAERKFWQMLSVIERRGKGNFTNA